MIFEDTFFSVLFSKSKDKVLGIIGDNIQKNPHGYEEMQHFFLSKKERDKFTPNSNKELPL